MNVEIITTNADPDRGGFGARVHALVRMFASFAEVRLTRTDGSDGPRVPGVEYCDVSLHDSLRVRLSRIASYYRTSFPRRKGLEAPDLVVVESLDLLGLHQYGPRVPFVLDEHNVYWDLLTYEIADAPFFRTWWGRRPAIRRRMIPRLLAQARAFEVGAIRSAARTFVTSEVDRAAILATCPEASPKVRVLPNCVDLERIRRLPDAGDSRAVTFVGDFAYVPNREAASFVLHDLAPSLPRARFLLVGARPPEGPRPANVVATGRVPDLSAILRASAVCIAPLAHGSGTRVKILTYLASSRAVVATSKACEGLPVVDGRHLLIRDDPREFRDAVLWLLADPPRRRRLAEAGRALVESSFDWRVHVADLRRWTEEAIEEAHTGLTVGGGARGATDPRRTPGDSAPSSVD